MLSSYLLRHLALTLTLFSTSALAQSTSHPTISPTAYASVFPNASLILRLAELGGFGEDGTGQVDDLQWSAQTIMQWSDRFDSQGPWTVTNKTVIPPSGDLHDYVSWAPYWWPNCTGVGNTTELTNQEIYSTCPYYNRDGLFVPDRLLVDNIGAFNDLSEAVLYSSLAWGITKNTTYAQRTTHYIRTWFLDEETRMNPNLEYAQMVRGPREDGSPARGARTGILDLKGMIKIAAAVEIVRQGGAEAWTQEVDDGLKGWMEKYEGWLMSNDLALAEAASSNNHASFYYAQLSAVQILLEDMTAAANTSRSYFAGPFKGQIEANGEQPLEAARTRPYHYRCYNLAAMVSNARLGAYAGLTDVWNSTTDAGGTIKAACDFTMDVPPGDEEPTELYPSVAAMHFIYGDDKYTEFLQQADEQYTGEPFYFWNQHPASLSVSNSTGSSSGNGTTTTRTNNNSSSGSVRSDRVGLAHGILAIGVILGFMQV